MTMIKKSLLLLTVAGFTASSTFAAGGAACCAGKASADTKANCMTFASLNITANQKTKLESWQSECMKNGCTKETRAAFMKKAKTILSKDQYAQLKSKCDQQAAGKTQS